MKLYLFDFDGTISDEDSFIEFIVYTKGKWRTRLGLLILTPVFSLFFLKLLSAAITKSIVLRFFFRNHTREQLFEMGRDYVENDIGNIIRPKAANFLQTIDPDIDKVVIVSASLDVWLLPFCEKYGYDLISTELEYVNHKFRGKLHGLNCHGEEKVRRIKATYNLESYQKIIAFGDTKGDLPMLKLADEPHYKPFRE